MKPESSWILVKEHFKKGSDQVFFDTWIEPLKFVKYDPTNEILYLQEKGAFRISTLEERYKFRIFEQAAEIFENLTDIKFLMPHEAAAMKKTSGSLSAAYNFEDDRFPAETINPLKTFETFVVGDNSRFAFGAAMDVAKYARKPHPGSNPLFIYGDSGLGKTHLMNAIANYVANHFPELNFLYVSSETFTNEFVSATMGKKMNSFKAKYRNIDLLMIDDIQFIEQKDKTIEEVFHTYNTLYTMGKQLVFSSDRPPKDLLGVDNRLKSRLEAGFMVDLQPPAFEIKVAILQKKAMLENIELTDGLREVIDLIAEKIKTNVREMEGAFNRIVALKLPINPSNFSNSA